MRKTIHIAGILILLVCLEVVWGEEGQQEEGGAEGSGDHSAEASPAPAPAQEAAAAPEGGTESPKKLARMGNSIVPVIVGIGAALL